MLMLFLGYVRLLIGDIAIPPRSAIEEELNGSLWL